MLSDLPKIYRGLDAAKICGIILSVATLWSGILLTGLSGWFITTTWLTGTGVLSLMAYNFFLPGAIIRLLAVSRPLLMYAERLFTHRVTFRLSGHSRVLVFKNILLKKRNEIVRFRSADLVVRITGDVEQMDEYYLRLVLPWTSALIAFFTASVMAYCYLPALAFNILSLFIFCGVFVPFLALRTGRRYESRCLVLFRELQEDLTGYREGLTDLAFFDCLNRCAVELFHKIRRMGMLQMRSLHHLALYTATSGMGIQLAMGSCLLILYQYGQGISGPVIVMIVLMTMSLSEYLYSLPESGSRLARTLSAGKRLRDVCQTAVQQLSYEQFPAGHEIVLRNISFSYGNRLLLNDLSFTVRQNSITALTGPNGAGKSTVLDLLTGLQEQQSGLLLLGGTPVSQIDPVELAGHTGYLEQRVTLFNGTIFENIALAKEGASNAEVSLAAFKAGLISNLATAPAFLATSVGDAGRHMSAGQGRMIALARIILQDAAILFLDEPTEGLSIAAENKFLELLASWKGSKTILIVTHKAEVANVADKTVEIGLHPLTQPPSSKVPLSNSS